MSAGAVFLPDHRGYAEPECFDDGPLSAGALPNHDSAFHHRAEEGRRAALDLDHVGRRAEHEIDWGKTVRDERAGLTQQARGLAVPGADEEKIDIAAGTGGAEGVRAEQDAKRRAR